MSKDELKRIGWVWYPIALWIGIPILAIFLLIFHPLIAFLAALFVVIGFVVIAVVWLISCVVDFVIFQRNIKYHMRKR